VDEARLVSARHWHPRRQIGVGRALAKAGYGTRAATDALVRSGRVAVDGTVIHDPAQPVGPESRIELDGEPLLEVVRRYFAFHKPLRVIFRRGEQGGERLVQDFLPRDVPGLRPAGRLDAQTSGLVLVSNDAAWIDLAVISRGLEREYRVEVAGALGDLEVGLVSSGIHLHNLGFIRPKRVEVLRRDDEYTELSLVFTHGRNRQVRRMFRSLRHEVRSLRRVRIGAVTLGNLPPGQLRPLTRAEIGSIMALQRRNGGGAR
jgi:23S rRNA pseudouridine2605 synthase